MSRSQSDGVLYMLTGTRHALNLAVSVYSLRKVYHGLVAVLAGCDHSHSISCKMGQQLDVHVLRWDAPDEEHFGGAIHSANKVRMFDLSPFERTLFLDADTLVDPDPALGVDVLEILPDDESIHLTQLGKLTVQQRPAHCSVDKWRDVAPEEVAAAVRRNGPAINTGVLAFTKECSMFFRAWQAMVDRRISFFCNEISAQLVFQSFKHRVYDDKWNRSPVYSKTLDPHIWHGHGNTFLTHAMGRWNWMPYCRELLEKNIGKVGDWLHLVPSERRPRIC